MAYIQGEGRNQCTLFPVVLDDLVPSNHVCRVIDAFVEKLDMGQLGFERSQPAATGRPGYDPRVLRLGMLDRPAGNPYASIGKDAVAVQKADPWTWPEHRALARKVTDESIVLLKNERGTLPLNPAAIRSIAVVGKYADQVLLDWYSGTPPYAISPLEGIRARVGDQVKVSFATGEDVIAAVALARQSDVVIAVVGNHPTCDAGWNQCPSPSDGKEAVDRKSIDLQQEPLLKQLYAANPRTIAVLIASFPFAAAWTQQHLPAVLTLTHNSEEQGTALADVLFGDYNPAGRLSQTWPASLDQLPPMMDYNIQHGRTYLYAKAIRSAYS